MLNRASVSITDRLVKVGVIKELDYEIYQFGIENFILKVCHLVSYILIGIIFRSLPELIIFLIAFIPLREYSGGYHAKTPFKCYIMSCITVISLVSLLNLLPAWIMDYSIILALSVSVLLFLIVPVEAVEKPLDEAEKTYYKSKAGFIILFVLGLVLLSRMLQWNYLSFILALSLAYEAVIALAGLRFTNQKS